MNITFEKNNYKVRVMRFGIHQSRRILVSKFAHKNQAHNEAENYAHYLRTCTFKQFLHAVRPVGRPFKSEYFLKQEL